MTTRDVIQQAQAATGLSQVRLAAAVGVDPSTLRRWLSGALPTPEPARRLLRALTLHPEIVKQLAG